MKFNNHYTIEIMKLSDIAFVTVRSPKSDVLDLRSAYDTVIPKHGRS